MVLQMEMLLPDGTEEVFLGGRTGKKRISSLRSDSDDGMLLDRLHGGKVRDITWRVAKMMEQYSEDTSDRIRPRQGGVFHCGNLLAYLRLCQGS